MKRISYENTIQTVNNKPIIYHNNQREIYDIPYISLGYWNPKPYDTEDVIIPLYITDFYQKEYLLNDNSLKFKLRIEIDGVISYIDNLQAGDHNINLGKFTAGMHYFTLQIIDEHGVESGRIANDLWVINQDEYEIKDNEIYTITERDLLTNNITINLNNNATAEQMQNNRVGLTNLFQSIKNNGYRKCILPQAIYRINRSIRDGIIEEGTIPIMIPSDFTVDLNQSTIKLHPYDDREYGDVSHVGGLMILFKDCHDSHLINGVIEGDYAERLTMINDDGTNGIQNGNGEFNHAILISGGSYNTLDNLTITQITGYNICGGMYGSLSGKMPNIGTAIDGIKLINGIEVQDDRYCTTPYADISNAQTNKYLACGVWLGYGGICGKHWDIDFNFYDTNKNFIECIRAYQQRRVRLPENAVYVRLTCKCNAVDITSLCYHHMNSMRYCEINNCHWIDNRTCMAIAQHQHLHVYQCDFTRSGNDITPGAVDFEDGWEQQQDTYIRYSNILEQSGTFDMIYCAGINYVQEYCDNWRIEIRYSTIGITIRHNTNCKITTTYGYKTLNSSRIYNNTNLILGRLGITEPNYYLNNVTNFKLIDNNIILQSADRMDKNTLYNCKVIITGVHKKVKCSNCEVQIASTVAYNNEENIFIRCTFTLHPDYTFNKFSYNTKDSYRLYKQCIFECPSQFLNHNYFNSGIWDKCVFNDVVTISPKTPNNIGDIIFRDCIFNADVTFGNRNNSYIKFINCTFNGSINYSTTEAQNLCIFE